MCIYNDDLLVNLLTSVFLFWGSKHYVPVGYKVTVDCDSMLGASKKIVEESRAAKEREYNNKPEIKDIAKKCYIEQVRNCFVAYMDKKCKQIFKIYFLYTFLCPQIEKATHI